MKGKFPDILNNPTSGETARKLYDDAQEMLDRMIEEKWLTANGVIGFFPANAVGDDIEVYTDDDRTEVLTTLHNLRQQGEHREGVPNRSLGDFVAPEGHRARRPRRRVRGHRRARQPGQDQGVQGGPRRLQRDPAGVAGRPARRGVRRAAAPAGAHRALGPRPRRAARQRGPDRREVRRHPPGPGLPRLPRAHREEHPLGAARRRGDHRHRAHRVDGDVAGRLGERLVLLPPAVAVLRGRPARPRPGRRRTPSARAGPSPRPSAGSPPTSATTPRTERCRLPAAVLWDMDGTLVDTEPYWMECEFALADEVRRPLDARARAGRGRRRPARLRGATCASTWASTARRCRSSRSCSTAWSSRSSRRCRGARARASCSPSCASRDVPCALVTMSWRRFVEPVLPALARGSFDAVVCGDEVDPRQAAPRALPAAPPSCSGSLPATPSPSRTRPPAPPRPRPPAARSWSSRTTCRCPTGDRREFRDSLEGLRARDLADLARPAP